MAYIRRVELSIPLGYRNTLWDGGETFTAYQAYRSYLKSCTFTSLVQVTYDDANQDIIMRINDDAELSLKFNDHKIYLDGEIASANNQINDHGTVLCVCSDNVFYLKIITTNNPWYDAWQYLYEIIDTGRRSIAYNGIFRETEPSRIPWEYIKLSGIRVYQRGLPEEERIYYAHAPWVGSAGNLNNFTSILNYSTTYKSIDYTASYLIKDHNVLTDLEDDNFLVCSYKPIDSIVSFEGINYYVVDNHTLIEIDIEEEEEDEEE